MTGPIQAIEAIWRYYGGGRLYTRTTEKYVPKLRAEFSVKTWALIEKVKVDIQSSANLTNEYKKLFTSEWKAVWAKPFDMGYPSRSEVDAAVFCTILPRVNFDVEAAAALYGSLDIAKDFSSRKKSRNYIAITAETAIVKYTVPLKSNEIKQFNKSLDRFVGIKAGNPFVSIATIKIPDFKPYLVKNHIEAGTVNCLAGGSGSGKTTLMANLLASVSSPSADKLFAGEKVIHGNVAFANVENYADANEKLILACNSNGVEIESIGNRLFIAGGELDLQDRTSVEEFIEAINDIFPDGLTLLVVDSFTATRGDADANNEAEAKQYIANLRLIIRRTQGALPYPPTVIVIAHLSKAALGNGTSSVRGSEAVTNLADSVFKLEIDTELDLSVFSVGAKHRGKYFDPKYFNIGYLPTGGRDQDGDPAFNSVMSYMDIQAVNGLKSNAASLNEGSRQSGRDQKERNTAENYIRALKKAIETCPTANVDDATSIAFTAKVGIKPPAKIYKGNELKAAVFAALNAEKPPERRIKNNGGNWNNILTAYGETLIPFAKVDQTTHYYIEDDFTEGDEGDNFTIDPPTLI